MTRITNIGRKRTYLEAGFEPTQEDAGGGDLLASIDQPQPGDTEPGNSNENSANEQHARAIPKDEATKKIKSEKRRLRRLAERHANTICFACREKGHGASDCPTAPQSDRLGELAQRGIRGSPVGGICYRCGSTRHRLNRCKKPENPKDPFPYAACFVCSGTGHLASSCPQNLGRGIYPKGGSCKLCGQTSHLAKDCALKTDDLVKPDSLVNLLGGSGADEDDFLVLKRRRKEVERDEIVEQRLERLNEANLKAEEKQKVSQTSSRKALVKPKPKVVSF